MEGGRLKDLPISFEDITVLVSGSDGQLKDHRVNRSKASNAFLSKMKLTREAFDTRVEE